MLASLANLLPTAASVNGGSGLTSVDLLPTAAANYNSEEDNGASSDGQHWDLQTGVCWLCAYAERDN